MAGFFGLFNYEKPGKGVSENAPEKKGMFRFFELFWRRIKELIILNVVFLFTCVPIFTIGAALSAMTKVIYDYIDGSHTMDVSDYFRAFKGNFKRGVLFGIINLAFTFGFLYNLVYFGFTNGLVSSYLTWLFGALTVLLYIVQFYVFNIECYTKESVLEVYTDAFILTLANLPKNILITVCSLIYPCIIGYLFFNPAIPDAVGIPIAGTLLTFTACSFTIFITTFFARSVLTKSRR